MYCMECGNELAMGAKFCSNCGSRVMAKMPRERKVLSERVKKVANRYNEGFEDNDLNDFVLSILRSEMGDIPPRKLLDLVDGTEFDNEEDLREIIYQIIEPWEEDDFEQAEEELQDSKGYHGAIGLCYIKGHYVEANEKKAIEHLTKAIELPHTFALLLPLLLKREDFETVKSLAISGMEWNDPYAYFAMSMLYGTGLGGIPKNALKSKEMCRKAMSIAEENGDMTAYRGIEDFMNEMGI